MITNPFDDPAGRYLVLVNAREQQSLWPADIRVPAGWQVAFGADTRQACTDFVRANAAARPRAVPPPRQLRGGPA